MPVADPVRLGPLAVEMLEGIYQHRLLSSAQLHEIYTPRRSREWAHRQIRKLERAGLAAAVRQPGGRKLLHLTPAGLAMVESVPPRGVAEQADHARARRGRAATAYVGGQRRRDRVLAGGAGAG